MLGSMFGNSSKFRTLCGMSQEPSRYELPMSQIDGATSFVSEPSSDSPSKPTCSAIDGPSKNNCNPGTQ